MTLGGLALGAGMLVDNAIVVMENIFRNLESGSSLKEASIMGTSQVGGAIAASTITTIAVFLPIVYLHGSAGELFKDQAWTVGFSLASSFVVAILVIPILITRILKTSPSTIQRTSIKFPRYASFLSEILQKRWFVIVGAIGIVMLAVFLIPFVGSEFIPKTDLGEFSIELKLPEGTELKRTEQTVTNIENIIYELLGDEIKTIYSKIGPTADLTGDETSVFEDENTATMKIILKQEHHLSSQEIISRLSKTLE